MNTSSPQNNYGQLANDMLARLIAEKPTQLSSLSNKGGIYLLYDHLHNPRYIGMTGPDKGFYDRIYRRHRSGSEHVSHQYSAYYNVGRMWRDRNDDKFHEEAKLSKKLRNKFIELHCLAATLEVDLPKPQLERLEKEIIRIAPSEIKDWNGNRRNVFLPKEPENLVDKTISLLNFSLSEIDAVNRQNERYFVYR